MPIRGGGGARTGARWWHTVESPQARVVDRPGTEERRTQPRTETESRAKGISRRGGDGPFHKWSWNWRIKARPTAYPKGLFQGAVGQGDLHSPRESGKKSSGGLGLGASLAERSRGSWKEAGVGCGVGQGAEAVPQASLSQEGFRPASAWGKFRACRQDRSRRNQIWTPGTLFPWISGAGSSAHHLRGREGIRGSGLVTGKWMIAEYPLSHVGRGLLCSEPFPRTPRMGGLLSCFPEPRVQFQFSIVRTTG